MKATLESRQAVKVWEIDPAHSSAQFSVRHLMISNVRGEFTRVTGRVHFDPADIENSSIEASVDVNSISTREPDRDKHLKSADFLDAEKFPTMTFKSQRVEKSDGTVKFTGDLTIHGTTRLVSFTLEGPTPPVKDPWGNMRMGASASGKINRKDFGVIWNQTLETGGVLVGEEISITLDVELVSKASHAGRNN